MQKVDYLIIGGALSGICLADSLRVENQTVALLTSPEKPSATAVAAGTWNPLVFRKYVLSWRFEEFYEGMKTKMRCFEKLLETELFEVLPIYKLIVSEADHLFWKTRSADPQMKVYMKAQTSAVDFPVNSMLAEIFFGGRIHLKNLIRGYHAYARTSDFLLEEDFQHEQLTFENGRWNYKHLNAARVIFCEGAHVADNPFFSWLPLKPANGDTITIHAPTLKLDGILKKNIFVLPLGKGYFQVGATYNWENPSWQPTAKAREEIETKLKLIINVPYKVVDQGAGIRPTSHDRRPIIGQHPSRQGLYVFNGLGTKGVLLAPLLADEFVNHLIRGGSIDPEVDVTRCFKHFKA